MIPIVHGLEAFYSNEVTFTYLDIDDPVNNEFKASLGYIVQPHFFLLDGDGNIINQWVGPVSADELASAIEAVK